MLQGVLSGAVSWAELEEQYRKDTAVYEQQLYPLIQSPEEVRVVPSSLNIT